MLSKIITFFYQGKLGNDYVPEKITVFGATLINRRLIQDLLTVIPESKEK